MSEIAGTTRDIISNNLTLLGNSLTLNDTAGLRQTKDTIEKKGIEKTIEIMNLSFIVCIILDLNEIYNNGLKFLDETTLEITLDYLKKNEMFEYFSHKLMRS